MTEPFHGVFVPKTSRHLENLKLVVGSLKFSMNDQPLSRSQECGETHNEAVGYCRHRLPQARPLHRVVNLVIVAARKEKMSQGIIFYDLRLVPRLVNDEFFKRETGSALPKFECCCVGRQRYVAGRTPLELLK